MKSRRREYKKTPGHIIIHLREKGDAMIITIDCEGSNYDDDISGSVSAMPKFLDICIDNDAKVILFLTGEFAKEFVKQGLYENYKDFVEFGLHIHPENLPEEVQEKLDFTTNSEFLAEYKRCEQEAILKLSYDFLKELGIGKVRYFRGGQFSINHDTLIFIENNFSDIEFESHCLYRDEYRVYKGYEKNGKFRIKPFHVTSYPDAKYLCIENLSYEELETMVKEFGYENAVALTHSYMFRDEAFRYKRDNIKEHINVKTERLLNQYNLRTGDDGK